MFSHLNYLHIAVATVVYFFIGALWYSVFFGKVWMKLVGVTPNEEDKKHIPIIFGTTFVLNFVITLVVAFIMHLLRGASVIVAVKMGLLLGVGLVGTTVGMNYMYAKRPVGLTLIDAGYHAVAITVVAVIFASWHY